MVDTNNLFQCLGVQQIARVEGLSAVFMSRNEWSSVQYYLSDVGSSKQSCLIRHFLGQGIFVNSSELLIFYGYYGIKHEFCFQKVATKMPTEDQFNWHCCNICCNIWILRLGTA